jgi:hypothetical protein
MQEILCDLAANGTTPRQERNLTWRNGRSVAKN